MMRNRGIKGRLGGEEKRRKEKKIMRGRNEEVRWN